VATLPQPTSAIPIADGDAATRKKVARVFESAGFATAQAPTGQEALDFLQSDPPAAAILISLDLVGVSIGTAAVLSQRPRNLARVAQTT
jgi:CheY-like chemotaxis protein